MEPQGCKRPRLPKIDLVKLVHFTKKHPRPTEGIFFFRCTLEWSPFPFTAQYAVLALRLRLMDPASASSLHILPPWLTLGWPRTPLLSVFPCMWCHTKAAASLSSYLKAIGALGRFSVRLAISPAVILPGGPMYSLFLEAVWDNQNKKSLLGFAFQIRCDDSLENWIYGENISLDTHRDNDKEIALRLFPEYAKHFLPSHLMYFFTKVFFFFFCKLYASFQEAKFSSILTLS